MHEGSSVGCRMNWFGFEPMACCPECGEWTSAAAYRDGCHECDPDARIEHHVQRARHELTRIEWELESYLATPRAQNLLAFTRYVEGTRPVRAPSTARQIHARASRPTSAT
jgi:hypothetical protein